MSLNSQPPLCFHREKTLKHKNHEA